MPYTHILNTSTGPFLAYLSGSRWVGRPAKRVAGTYAVKARYTCDILAAGVIGATPL